MKRRLFALILALTVVFAMTAGVRAEEGDPSFVVGSATVDPGEEFTVPVSVSNNIGVISTVLEITWSDDLVLVKAEDQELFSNGILSPLDNEPFIASWIMAERTEDNCEDGQLLLLTFRMAEDAEPGSKHTIQVEYNRENVFDYKMDNMPFETVDGEITVKGSPSRETTAATMETTAATTTATGSGSDDGEDGTEASTTPATNGSANTGDDRNVFMMSMIFAVSLAAILLLGYLWKKDPKTFKRTVNFRLVFVLILGMAPICTTVRAEGMDGKPGDPAQTTTAATTVETTVETSGETTAAAVVPQVRAVISDPEVFVLNTRYELADGASASYVFTPAASGYYQFTLTDAQYAFYNTCDYISFEIVDQHPCVQMGQSGSDLCAYLYVFYLEKDTAYTINYTFDGSEEQTALLRGFQIPQLQYSTASQPVTNQIEIPVWSHMYASFTPESDGLYAVYQQGSNSYSAPTVFEMTENGYDWVYSKGTYYVEGNNREVYQFTGGKTYLLRFEAGNISEVQTLPIIVDTPPIAQEITLTSPSAYVFDAFTLNPVSGGYTVVPEDAFVNLTFSVENPNGTELRMMTQFGTGCMVETGSVAGTGKLTVTDNVSGVTNTVDFNVTPRPVATDMYLENTSISCVNGDWITLHAQFGPSQSLENVIFSIKEDDDPNNDDLVALDEVVVAMRKVPNATYIRPHESKTGTVTIVAESQDTHIKDECVVTVNPKPNQITGIAMEYEKRTNLVGDDDYLYFDFLPEELDYSLKREALVQITSSDPEVVQIPEPEVQGTSCHYRCLKAGTAQITISHTTEAGETYSDTCTIIVQESVLTESAELTVAGIEPATDEKGTYYPIPEGASILVNYNRYPENANDYLFFNYSNMQIMSGAMPVENANGIETGVRIDVTNFGECELTLSGENFESSIRIVVVKAEDLDASRNFDAYLDPHSSKTYRFTPAESGYYVFYTNSAQGELNLSILESGEMQQTTVISTCNSVGGEYGCGAYLQAGTTYRLVCENDSKFSVYSYLMVRKAKAPTTVAIVSENGHNLVGYNENFYPVFDSVEHFGPVRWGFTTGRSCISDLSITDHNMQMYLATSGSLEITASLLEGNATGRFYMYIKDDLDLDVDMDGGAVPTAEDVNALCTYLTGYTDTADVDVADINGNEDINAKDAVILARYIDK